MSRQDRQTAHEKWWRQVNSRLKEYFTTALTGYVDTSSNQNYIGAEAAAFDRQMLPILEWKGPGEVVQRQLFAGAPPVYVQQVVKPTGIAGIVSGQIWNGGLQDNGNNGPVV